jgi:hypothetical protein
VIDDDNQKKALLLASVGISSLAYVRDLNWPTELSDDRVDYKKLVKQLRHHYGKKTATLDGRSEFTNMRQQENQSTEDFAAALLAAAVHCQFGGDLDTRLRDQFGIGLRTDAIRKRLMEKDDVTFAEAFTQAVNLERITTKSKQVGRGESSVSIVGISGCLTTGKYLGGFRGGNRPAKQQPSKQS